MMEKYVCTLTPEVLRDCQTEVKETDALRDESVLLIYQWLQTETKLHAKTDYFSILRFLRACKYDIDKTKEKIRCFYKLRGSSPEWFDNRDPSLKELQALLKIGVFLPLMKRDNGRLVVVIRIAAHNPRKHKQDDVFKIGIMTLDWVLEHEEDTSVYGVSAVFDMAGVSLGHVMQLTTSMIRRAVHSWQDCYPVRVKALCFINAPPHVNVVLSIFKKFMKSKLKERISIHGSNMDTLHKVVSKEVLPIEYGGTEGTIESLQEHWMTVVSQGGSWYKDDEKFRAEC